MGLERLCAYRVVCDHDDCCMEYPSPSFRPWFIEGSTVVDKDVKGDAHDVAIAADWVVANDRWLCPDHWVYDDADNPVEVGVEAPLAHMCRLAVDPVVVTCAVRYAMGRSSYLPGLIADEVRACWDDLGDQREVIREDVRRWLADPPRAPWTEDRETWEILARWMADFT